MDFLNLGRKFFLLAPMAGYSNSPCRKIFRQYGADGSVSEFVHCRAVLNGSRAVLERMAFDDGERPIGIQIFGADPSEMAEAAAKIEELLKPDFIDVNFGCPAPNAVDAGAGAAMLKKPDKMAEIISRICGAIKTPVTAKMRIGWDSSSIIVPEAAVSLASAGAKMITLHGRTKTNGYRGESNWALIEETAQKLQVPLVGNGSVEKLSAGELVRSACAGFMVGRAALGNPWIFGLLKRRLQTGGDCDIEVPARERVQLAVRYAKLVCDGSRFGVSKENLTHAKGQIMRFIKGCPGFKKIRSQMHEVKSLEELEEILCAYL